MYMKVCEACGHEFGTDASLGTHLWKTHHMSSKEYYDKYLRKPEDGICATCGKPTLFRTLGQGYLRYCSKKCSAAAIANDPAKNAHKVAAMKATMMADRGVENASQLEEVKQKRKATMKERHGVEYYSQISGFGDMCKKTNMERHGVPSYIMLPEFQAKLREANMKRIGVPYNFCKNTDNAVEEYRSLLSKNDCELLEFADKKHIRYRCNRCNSEMTEQDLFIKGRIAYGLTQCSVCHGKDAPVSATETELDAFIRSLGFETSHYDRNFLGAYGADIVVESKKLIIEFDGIYWHSELYHDSTYHLKKTELAENLGYRLIHIFSDEWETKRELVKNRLRSLLGMTSKRVYARKCSVREVSADTAAEFLDANHIQGNVFSKTRYGLYNGDDLVAVMTFGKSRFKKSETELLRYCTRSDTSVIGGAGKLFRHYIDCNPEVSSVVSYADRRWTGKESMYLRIGFVLDGISEPSYYYVIDGLRYNRMLFMKHKLVKEGFDAAKTEHEIMYDRGYYRIYDCGNYKFTWTR